MFHVRTTTRVASVSHAQQSGGAEPDLLVVVGPGCDPGGVAGWLSEDQRKQGLEVMVVGDGLKEIRIEDLPPALPPRAHLYITCHGDKSVKGDAHKLTLAHKELQDTVAFVKALRARYPQWLGVLHLSSCFAGLLRKLIADDPSLTKELGTCFLYASAKHPLLVNGRERTLEALCACLRANKLSKSVATAIDVYAWVQAEAEECFSAFGEEFGGSLTVHSPETPSDAFPSGLRKQIEKARPLTDRKAQVVGEQTVLEALFAKSAQLERSRAADWVPKNRLEGGLLARIRGGVAEDVRTWFADPQVREACDHWTVLAAIIGFSRDPAMLDIAREAQFDLKTIHKRSRETLLHRACSLPGSKSAQAYAFANKLISLGLAVEAEAINKMRPLHVAARNGSCDLALLLTGKGAKTDAVTDSGETILHMACSGPDDPQRKLMIESFIALKCPLDAADAKKRTALHLAVSAGNMAAADVLLKNGASPAPPNAKGLTPLHLLCLSPNAIGLKGGIAARLVQADPEAVDRRVPGQRESLLGLTIKSEDASLVEALMGAGATIEARELELALQVRDRQRRVEIVKSLLKDPGDAQIRLRDDRTLLHHAAEEADEALIGLLLEKGVDPTLQDAEDQTALAIAEVAKLPEKIIAAIKAAAANFPRSASQSDDEIGGATRTDWGDSEKGNDSGSDSPARPRAAGAPRERRGRSPPPVGGQDG